MKRVKATGNTSRRSFLTGLGVAAASVYMPSVMAASEPSRQHAIDKTPSRNSLGIKALVFDAYGTCTDYWSTMLASGKTFNRTHGVDIDWSAVARAWNGLYPSTFREVVSGARPWQSPSLLREEALMQVLQRQGVTSPDARTIAEFSDFWNKLILWDDVLPGLTRLHPHYPLASLSNADMAGMVALARYRHLPWDLVLTGEIVEKFKPAAEVYELAPRFLNLKPEEILMVACHKADLLGAQATGMRTALVRRPLELGPNGNVDATPDTRFDINVAGMVELDHVLHRG